MVAAHDEKIGGNLIDHQAVEDFNEAIQQCDLVDLGFSVSRFTWSNYRTEEGAINSRLDRALCNFSWKTVYPNSNITHLTKTCSDHAPLLLSIISSFDTCPKPFKFQKMWLAHSSFLQTVTNNWSASFQASPMRNFSLKLKCVKEALKNWNKNTFKNIFQNVMDLEDDVLKLEYEFERDPSATNRMELQKTKSKLDIAQLVEE